MAQPPPFLRNFAGRLPSRSPDDIPEPRPTPTSPRRGSLEDVLLHVAYDGNLRLVKKTARALDGGQGRIAEKVRAVRYSDGMGALHVAAGGGRLPVCRYLVEELRLDVNAAEYLKGETPLTLAINAEIVDVVQYLLDHGADTEKLNKDGLTALHFAAGQGLCEIVEVLLSKGADIDALTLGGTALHCAAYNGRVAVVKLLLDHHADHSKRAWGVFTPLMSAIYARSLECVKLLLEAGADVQGVEKETPLMIAAADGLTDILECSVQAGADPNALDCLGQTPLEIAARFSSRKDVEILFPVTSRIVGVSDWSVDGIIDYMKSVPPAKVADVHNARLAGGKFQGREAVKNKDYIAATKIYTEAMDPDPDDATLFSNRSLCWFHLGEGKKALLDAQVCRSMRPGWAKACYREGAALMLLKEYEKACGAFLDALKLEPGNTETKCITGSHGIFETIPCCERIGLYLLSFVTRPYLKYL